MHPIGLIGLFSDEKEFTNSFKGNDLETASGFKSEWFERLNARLFKIDLVKKKVGESCLMRIDDSRFGGEKKVDKS